MALRVQAQHASWKLPLFQHDLHATCFGTTSSTLHVTAQLAQLCTAETAVPYNWGMHLRAKALQDRVSPTPRRTRALNGHLAQFMTIATVKPHPTAWKNLQCGSPAIVTDIGQAIMSISHQHQNVLMSHQQRLHPLKPATHTWPWGLYDPVLHQSCRFPHPVSMK